MDNACLSIRQYMRKMNARYAVEANLCNRWNGDRDIMLSEERNVRIVLRLEDRRGHRRGPYIGPMSIIVHSCHEPSHSINARIAKTLRGVPDFTEEANRDRSANNEFGVVGRFYLPPTCAWTRLDDATLKAIFDLYQRISGALFDAGLYV